MILLAYGAFISATAYVIWNTVLKYYSANEMGMYKLFIPIFGSVLSVIILDESFTRNLLMGLVLVILGSLVLNVDFKKLERIKKVAGLESSATFYLYCKIIEFYKNR